MRDLLSFESARLVANKEAFGPLTFTFEELSFRELAAITFPYSSPMTAEVIENFGLTATLKLTFRKPKGGGFHIFPIGRTFSQVCFMSFQCHPDLF